MATFTNAGGGGGLDTDELTATAGDILKGKTAGVKGSDEPVAGTLELTGDAADSTVLAGKTYYNTDAKTKRTGTMANQGAKTSSLNCGGSYTIPAGYHNGAGKITANSLASQTGGVTAEDKYVYTGKTYWRDGVKRTGSMTVSSVVSFSAAAYSTTQFTCTWKWPSKGPYSGVIIRGKLGGYPSSVSDGQLYYQGTGNNTALGTSSSIIISGAQVGSSGTTYYFRIWVYCTCSVGNVYSGYAQAAAVTKPQGQQIFTSSGTFTVPANTNSIDVFCVGGGGGGSAGWYTNTSSDGDGGRGGAGGYTTTKKSVQVSPGISYVVTVGAGAQGGLGSSYHSNKRAHLLWPQGGASSVGELCIAGGGLSAGRRTSSSSYDGGTAPGGNGGSRHGRNEAGYSDGAGIYNSGGYYSKGIPYETAITKSYYGLSSYGQGKTTRAFEESSGILYSGSGGAGGWNNKGASDYYGGSPGGDGGGAYGGYRAVGNSASANTGGGGGGGGTHATVQAYEGGAGGSGIVIVRWGY